LVVVVGDGGTVVVVVVVVVVLVLVVVAAAASAANDRAPRPERDGPPAEAAGPVAVRTATVKPTELITAAARRAM
jgi:hypothetical protein